MPMTEAQRKANRKWSSAHQTVLSSKMRKEEAEAFKEACKVAGTSPNAVFLAAMRSFMEAHGNSVHQEVNEEVSESE